MNCKKLLAFALTAALFVSACTNVFAAAVAALQMTVSQPVDLNVDQSPEGVVVAEDEVVSMRETQVQANAGKTSGTCGASLKWNYNTSSCVLTISGSGAMKKWSFSDAKPWETYKKKIKKVIINDGVTSIGDYAFNQHSGITHVTIPTSVKSIGISAFESCTALTELYIPDSVTYIGDGAFCACHCLKKITIPATAKVASDCIFLVNGCSSLTEIAIPNTVKEIGFAAFGGCSSLKSIIVPKSIQVVYKQAFSGCEQLKDVYYAGSQSDWRGISVDNRGNESFYCNATVHYNYKAPSTASIASIAIVKKPSKQTYTAGETFTSAGMKLKVTYSDNTTKEITSGFTCTPSGKLNTVGQQKIVVSYGGKSTGFYVTVNKAVSSIAVNTKPTKQTYTAGDTLNTAGMKIKVTYTDKTTKVITKGFTCSPTKLNTVGQQKITVSYGGKTTNFTVKVNKKTTKVKSIAISNKPSTLSYRKGETLKTSGMKLKVTYTDGTSKVITSGFTCSPTKLNTAGKQKITVSYGGKTTTFTVTVSSLQKITQSNVATVLEKQIRWYAAYRNSFTWHSFKKTGRNIAFTDSYGVEYYRVYDYNSIKEVQNELSKYMIVPTNCVKQRSLLKEKSGKLYAMEFYGGVVAYDLKSVTLKEFKNNAYYVYVNVYEVTEYYTKDLLKVVEKDGQYKIESFVEGNTDYDAPRDMDSHPERYHLVAGLGD